MIIFTKALRYLLTINLSTGNRVVVFGNKAWEHSPKCPFGPLFSTAKLGYQNTGPSTWDLCKIWASAKVSTQNWGCGNETREGARWQSVGSLRLERDGQDKQATGGLKNEWINIQTKVNSAGESNPVSAAGEVWTYEFSLKSLKELLCIWLLSILALGSWGWGTITQFL